MQKYLALIVAALVLILVIVAGVFHILPTSEVTNVVSLVIAYILGHVTTLATVHYVRNQR